MPNASAPDNARDPKTPDDVEITMEAREPIADPALGIAVAVAPDGTPKRRLVAIGDSLTHGSQSAAIFNTDFSYPAVIAYELGWYDSFRHPNYHGYGGLPLNIEYLLRQLEDIYGDKINWWELAPALFTVGQTMDEVEDLPAMFRICLEVERQRGIAK